MTTWFTSDEHHGHARICELSHRPFPDVEAMTEAIVERHNARVKPGDVVYHLGDFSLDVDIMADVLPRLNGVHHLISGNHDRCHPSHRAGAGHAREYLGAGWKSVIERRILGDSHLGRVFLCHLPMGMDGHGAEPRYPAWRPTAALLADSGCKALLHGHVHELYAERMHLESVAPSAVVQSFPCVNVGVDVRGFAPVSAAEVRAILAGMGAP